MIIALVILGVIGLLLTHPGFIVFMVGMASLYYLIEFLTAVGLSELLGNSIIWLPLIFILSGVTCLFDSRTRKNLCEMIDSYDGQLFKASLALLTVALLLGAITTTSTVFDTYAYVFNVEKIPLILVAIPFAFGVMMFLWLPFLISLFILYIHFMSLFRYTK